MGRSSLPRRVLDGHRATVTRIAPTDLPGLLDEVAAAVAAALGGLDDWGEAGTRPGQHHSDLAADAAAVDLLTAAGVGVLSEESGRHHPERAVTVVVDPLDGSTNAARRMSWWATSLCAVDADGPVAALVVDLRYGTRWTAQRGAGARRDGEPLEPPAARPWGESIVALNGLPTGHAGWAQYRTFGAAALDLCAVADGTLDGYLDATTDELGSWDYLGGLLVCREAGVVVEDVFGRDLVVLDHAARRTPLATRTPEAAAALRSVHPALAGGADGPRP